MYKTVTTSVYEKIKKDFLNGKFWKVDTSAMSPDGCYTKVYTCHDDTFWVEINMPYRVQEEREIEVKPGVNVKVTIDVVLFRTEGFGTGKKYNYLCYEKY